MSARTTVGDLIREARKILKVSDSAANEYKCKAEKILAFVNETLASREDIFKLIGGNPLQIMYDKHRYHVNFMATVFRYILFDLLVRGSIWNYKIYLNHGFSKEYFSLELKTWIKAIEEYITFNFQPELIRVYKWLLERQARMMRISEEMRVFDLKIREKWREHKAEFLIAVLTGDDEKALEIAKNCISLSGDVATFYTEIVQPVMYELGSLWEGGKISVLEEHLATSIVSKILAILYEKQKIHKSRRTYKAIVTAAPNEYHELGARMLADLLEAEGWKVYYLGANVPEGSIISMVEKVKPELLCISVTLIYNVERAERIIREVKRMKAPPKVLVGGLAFNLNPSLYKKIGADLWAKDVKNAIKKIKTLFKVRHKSENLT